MKLSIIILTHNSLNSIESCVKALLDTVRISPVEWIVVDNGSADGSPQLIKKLLPQVNLILNRRNHGVSRARNQGIQAATGQYVLLLDDDTRVLPDAIDVLCEYLDQHPQCGMAGPQLINPDGSFQANSLPLPTLKIKCFRIIKKITGKPLQNPYQDHIDSQRPFQPGYLIGACQLIRQEAINSVGLLDENIFYGPEDADYCLRLKEHEYKIVCLPSSRVIHDYQRQSYRLKKAGLLWHHIKGIIYFWWKHKLKF